MLMEYRTINTSLTKPVRISLRYFPRMIMYTFFEENVGALAGKNLLPFSTHEGSGLSGFDKKLSFAVPGSTVLKGLATRGNDCQNKQDSVRKSVNDWIADLGF